MDELSGVVSLDADDAKPGELLLSESYDSVEEVDALLGVRRSAGDA